MESGVNLEILYGIPSSCRKDYWTSEIHKKYRAKTIPYSHWKPWNKTGIQ